MLGTSSQGYQGGGKSRFSKALPPPPPLDKCSSLPSLHQPPTSGKSLPATPAPSLAAKQLLPPPKDAKHKPIPSPNMTVAVPLPPPPYKKMTITRRHVAADSKPPQSPADLSPAISISSLLSAYSNRLSASTQRTSTGNWTNDKASLKDSAHESSDIDDCYDIKTEDVLPSQNDGFRTSAHDPEHAASVLRVKDAGSSLSLPVSTPGRKGPSLLETLMNTSPSPQSQLLGRRFLKSDKSVAVSELKLATSNNSTAATAAQALEDISVKAQSRPLSPPAPEKSESVPGRTIRPAPSQAPQTSPTGQSEVQDENMGQGQSNIKSKLRKTRAEADSPQKDKHGSETGAAVRSPVGRLPTPEYAANDIQSPGVQHVVSPVSPASPATTPELRIKAMPKIQRKAVRASSHRQVRPAKSTPALTTQENLTAAPKRTLPGLPESPAPNRETMPEQSQFLARTSSRTAQQQGVDNLQVPKHRSSADSDKTFMPVSRVKTDAPVTFEDTTTAEPATTENPGAARFPRDWFVPESTKVMSEAAPIQHQHHHCFTGHKTWVASGQQYYPISCRTCACKDYMSNYWVCAHCSLRVCFSCRNDLQRKFKGNLKQLVEELNRRDPAAGLDRPRTADVRGGVSSTGLGA